MNRRSLSKTSLIDPAAARDRLSAVTPSPHVMVKRVDSKRRLARLKREGWVFGLAVCCECGFVWKAALQPVKNPPLTALPCPKCEAKWSFFV